MLGVKGEEALLDLYKFVLSLIILILICGLCSGLEPSRPSGHQISAGNETNDKCLTADCHPVSSLESLLRNESVLTAKFGDLLNHTPTTIKQKYNFMLSFEDLIRRQSMNLATFSDILNVSWNQMNDDEQETFLSSFNDLIGRQFVPLSSFEYLINEDWGPFSPDDRIELLSSYEDLLRRQSNLIKSYEELYRTIHGGITIVDNVDRTTVKSGDTVTYTYAVKNWFSNQSIVDVAIIDDLIGPVVSNVSLKPQETKYFSKREIITRDTSDKATVIGKTFANYTERAESNVVSVKIIRSNKNNGSSGKNDDSIKIGNQIASSFGIEANPLTDDNSLEIKENQRANCSECGIYNSQKIEIGDQIISSSKTGSTNNRIKIVTNQE
jgi:uncharacterized repeat protein (TIGR01451 family)